MQTPVKDKMLKSSVKPHYDHDAKIDFSSMFHILWSNKLWITLFTIIISVFSSLYVSKQPNVYESKTVLQLKKDPYDISASKGQLMTLANITDEPFKYFKSDKWEKQIADEANLSVLNVKMSKNNRSNEITISKQGSNAEDVFEQVSAYSKYLNQVYKKNELTRVRKLLILTKSLLNEESLPEAKKTIGQTYGYLIYIEKLLESDFVDLIVVISKPVKASHHIKPKRALIVIIATLLAVIWSSFVILGYYALRKKKIKL